MDRDKAIELAKLIFTELRGDIDTAPKVTKQNIFNQLINMDVDPEIFRRRMIEYRDRFPDKAKTITNPYNIIHIPDNLIKDRFYYHPHLQVKNKMPKLKQLDNGEFVEYYEDKFRLINKSIFLPIDLVLYYHSKMRTKSVSIQRDIGSLKRVLEVRNGDLDLVLSTIDSVASSVHYNGMTPPKSPLYITDYIPDGKRILDSRVSSCRLEGLDHEMVD